MTRLTDFLPHWHLHLPGWLRTGVLSLLLCFFVGSFYHTLTTGEAWRAGTIYKRSERPEVFWFVVVLHVLLIFMLAYFVIVRILQGQI
jgi:hypothetical protein